MRTVLVLGAVLVIGAHAGAQCVEHPATYKVIAVQGDAPPGTPGDSHFLQFSLPSISSDGLVALPATFTGPIEPGMGEGLWAWKDGQLVLVVRDGDPAPGQGEDVIFADLGNNPYRSIAGDGGRLCFTTRLKGRSVNFDNDESVWRWSGGRVGVLVREGTEAPGTPHDVFFSGNLNPVFNDAGLTVQKAGLKGNGVNSGNSSGYWGGVPGDVQLLLRTGVPAPGTPGKFLTIGPPSFNDAGDFVFLASTNMGQSGMWLMKREIPELVSLNGDQAPGLPPGVTLKIVPNGERVAFSNSGHIAFKGLLAGPGIDSTNYEGIWVGTPGALVLRAQRGQQAPGTPDGVTFKDLDFDPVVNASGQFVFAAFLGGNVFPSNDTGMWWGDGQTLKLIWREGDPVPDHADWHLGDFADNSHARVSLNAAGQATFRCTIPDGDEQGAGVFVYDPAFGLRSILLTGETVWLRPGDARVVRQVLVEGDSNGSGGSDGVTSALSDSGQIVLMVRFTDEKSAVLTATVGEPPCRADANSDGSLDIDDFIGFQLLFALGLPGADMNCDGSIDVDDFIAFQTLFGVGCD